MKISVIGCGPWGQNIIRTLKNLRAEYSFELFGVGHTGDRERAQTVRDIVSIKPTTDIQRLIDESDAVAVATPDETHPRFVERSLRSGCDVFVEKPITHTPGRARELYDLAESRDRRLMVGQLMVYHPAVQCLNNEVIEDKAEPVELFFDRFNNLRADGGRRLLHSSFIHDCSILDYFFHDTPDAIDLHDTGVEDGRIDYVRGTLRWSDRCLARFQCGMRWPARRRLLSIRTTNSFYEFDGIEETVAVYDDTDARHADPTIRSFDRLPLTSELEDFLECLLNDAQSPRVGRDHVLRVMDTIGRIEERITGC